LRRYGKWRWVRKWIVDVAISIIWHGAWCRYSFIGAHTQHIERVWRKIRGNIPKYGTKEDRVLGYLSEYLFKRVYSRLERIEAFFKVIAELYSPFSKNQLETKPEPSISAA